MKIFHDLSKIKSSDTFKHDAKLITGLNIGFVSFLLVSSVTVYSGISIHMEEYLADSALYLRWPTKACAYLFGSLTPDIINSICFAYIVAALLRKDYRSFSSVALILFSSSVSVFLTYYSYNMSQSSALVVGNDITNSNISSDSLLLAELKVKHGEDVAIISDDFDREYKRIVAPYDEQVKNTTQSFDNQIATLQSQIAIIEKNTSSDNYLYANKQKAPIIENIKRLESQKLRTLSPILQRKEAAISAVQQKRDIALNSTDEVYMRDRTEIENTTSNHNNAVMELGTMISFLLSKISGWGVFLVLFLTAMKEILYFRNGIEPTPVLSNFDFSPSWMVEVLAYPLVWLRNHSVHFIRAKYKELPDPTLPPIHKELWDGKSLDQKVVRPSAQSDDEEAKAPHAVADKEVVMAYRISSDDAVEITADIPIQGSDPVLEQERIELEEQEQKLDLLAIELENKKSEQEQKEAELHKRESVLRLKEQEQEQKQEQKKVAVLREQNKKTIIEEHIAFAKKHSKKSAYSVLKGKQPKMVIEHKSKDKEGNITIKEYTETEVQGLINKYKVRVDAAIEKGKKDVEQNNTNWMNYWEGRIQEFTSTIA